MKIKISELKKIVREEVTRSKLIRKWEKTGLLKNLVSEEKKFRAAKFLNKHISEAQKEIKATKMSKTDAKLRTEAVIKAAAPLLK